MFQSSTMRGALGALFIVAVLPLVGGCVTVRPEQRAILADPTMRFDTKDSDQAAMQHVLENREGSFGGGAVEGGGCGCN